MIGSLSAAILDNRSSAISAVSAFASVFTARLVKLTATPPSLLTQRVRFPSRISIFSLSAFSMTLRKFGRSLGLPLGFPDCPGWKRL
jgi:hypothetical protein